MVARDNGWPVIVIGGRRPIHDEGIGYFQELDAVPIFHSVTKWAATVERVSEVVPAVLRAYEMRDERTAGTGVPRPSGRCAQRLDCRHRPLERAECGASRLPPMTSRFGSAGV